MNRKIKFRAWDDLNGMMISEAPILNSFTYLGSGEILKRYTLVMQYTGIKDKNGVEIFEGDLLRYPANNEWEKENYVVFEVFFHDGDCADTHIGFQFNRLHFKGCIAGYHSMEKFLPKYTAKMEVIGNVYDSPELITK